MVRDPSGFFCTKEIRDINVYSFECLMNGRIS